MIAPIRAASCRLIAVAAAVALSCVGPGGSAPDARAAGTPAAASATRAAAAAPPGATLPFSFDPLLGARPFPARIQSAGRTLLLCDTPEQVHGPGILYRDAVNGPFRVFMYAVAAASRPLWFTLVASNPTAAPISVRITRAGAAGPSSELHAVAVLAEQRYFQPGGDRVVTVPAGASITISGALPAVAARSGQLVNAIVDGSPTAPGLVLSVAATAHRHADWARLPLLPPGPGRFLRGTFPNADFNVAVSGHGDPRYLLVGERPRYLHGYSAADHRALVDYGNFGVLYNVQIYESPLATAAPPGTMSLLFMDRGVTYAGVVVLAGGSQSPARAIVLASGANLGLARGQAIVVGHFGIRAGGLTLIHMQWMPAGASTLPAAFLIQPA